MNRERLIAAMEAAQKSLALRTTPGLALVQVLGDGHIDAPGTLLDNTAAEAEDLVAAAVLVPLVMHEGGATVLLTQRTANLRHHPGQISFPGGHIEPEDTTAEAAALREAREEVGLDPQAVEVLGRMDQYRTGTGFEVTPIVGLVAPGYSPKLDETEVAEIFEVPLDFVMDAGNHRRESRIIRGQRRDYYVLPYEDRYIWGEATAGMLINLYEILSA